MQPTQQVEELPPQTSDKEEIRKLRRLQFCRERGYGGNNLPDPGPRLSQLGKMPEIQGLLKTTYFTKEPESSSSDSDGEFVPDAMEAGLLVEMSSVGYGDGTRTPFVVLNVGGTAKRPGSKAFITRLLVWDDDTKTAFIDPSEVTIIRLTRGKNYQEWVPQGDSAPYITTIHPVQTPVIDHGLDK